MKELVVATKILIVVTGHSELGNTGKKTGYYLPEVSHPYYALVENCFQVDIASINGGKAPMDESSRDLSDPYNKKLLEEHLSQLENTLKLSEIKSNEYTAILFAGGHGTMWDFPNSTHLAQVASEIYAQGGIVAAVCHGPAALINIKTPQGAPIVAGKNIATFTNEEEAAAGLTDIVPFLLETELKKQGAIINKAPLWQKNVIVDGRLVTGQNPSSAKGVGHAIAKLLKK